MGLKWCWKHIIDLLSIDRNLSFKKICISKYSQVCKMQYNCLILNGNFKIFLTHVSGQKCYDEKCTVYVIYVPNFYFFLNAECKCTKIIHNCLNIINLIPTQFTNGKKMSEGNVDKLHPWVHLFFFNKRPMGQHRSPEQQ